MSSPITREDAVLAVRLWAIATHHYHPTSVIPLRAPDPVGLYAGMTYGGDPVQIMKALVEQITELANEWGAWTEEDVCPHQR